VQINSGSIIFKGDTGLTVGGNFTPTERMRITSTGLVGINNTNPSTRLSLGTDVAPIKLAVYDPGVSGCYGIGVGPNVLTFGASINAATGTPQMTLLNSGALGINLNPPVYALDILVLGSASIGTRLSPSTGTNATCYTATNTSSALFMGVDSSAGGALVIGSLPYAAVINQQGNQAMQFGTSNAIRMTIGAAGTIAFPALPSVAPAAGSKQIWYDPADSNRLKYVP
jgi:hypothetical protein